MNYFGPMDLGAGYSFPDLVLPAQPTVPAADAPFLQRIGLTNSFDPRTGAMTNQGWGGLALGAAQGLLGAYMGMKQYGLAKDQLAEGKRQFNLNFGAQRQLTNASLADRQAARVASNPGAYASVAEYMSKYGIPGG